MMVDQQVTRPRSDKFRKDKQLALDPYWLVVTDVNNCILKGLGQYMDDFPYLSIKAQISGQQYDSSED